MALDSYAIGIDLGTANTRVGVYRDGQVEIIPHEGRSSMPSYVAFTETGRLIGAAAKSQVGINPKNTVFDALRLIGRTYSDGEIQADMKHFPFQVLEKKGKPFISVEYRGDTKLLTPEEILSMILSRAKKDAEIYLGSTIKGAVITVPSYFNSSQRQAIRDAALISELPVLLLINGPTAACSDYMVTHRIKGERNVLVADFGAGTFNVVLAVIEEGILEVKSTASDLHLGGEDYDNRMVNHFINEFKRKRNQDLTVNRRALCRLRTACEAAKCELSSRKQTQVEIDSLYNEFDFTSTITRTRFEELCQDLFRSSLDPVERVLRDGKMDKSSVHEVIVIGGSSRIPKIQKLFSDFLGGKELSKFLNPDETVARGAAMHAAIMSRYNSKSSNLNEFLLLDVAPLTLGIEATGGVMAPMIRRNTTIPTRKSKVVSTYKDNQASFLVSAFEGERARTKDNIPLGKFSVPVSPAPQGIPRIEITFDCDEQGNMWVAAVEKETGKQNKIYLQYFDRLSAEEIERMKAEAQRYDAVDKAEAERVSARNALESHVYSVKSDVIASDPRNASILRVATLADILLGWLDENQSAPASEYLLRLTGLREVAASIASESIDTDTTKVEAFERVSPPESSRASPALSEPIESSEASTITDISPLDIPRSSEKRMSELFSESNGEERAVYTDAEFIRISTYLRNTGRPSWSNVPRLYAILRLIGQLPMLDAIVDQGITDFWFPFTSASLPDDLSPSARANFLQSQSMVLSKALRFEKSSDRKHAHFAQGEPLPFEVVGRLGSGAHGYVDKVMSTVSHREYARKLFRRTKGVSKDEIKSFLMELQVLKRVSHIHCVELVQSYTDPKYFALIMSPVAECNLFEYYDIVSGSSDKMSLLRSFFGCLANALQYVHNIKIRHRDIKPQNVLVKADRVLLTDFGIALDWEHLSRSTTTADSGKTWPYAAPEVARYEKRNTSTDVWSLGCIFLEMATVLKGESVTNMRNFFRERTENYRFYANLAHVPEWMDKLRELGLVKDNMPLEWVTHMLRETPEHRPTAVKLFNDISAKCASQHIPFCGPCCREDIESSDLDDGDDDDELWGHEGEPTLESVEA